MSKLLDILAGIVVLIAIVGILTAVYQDPILQCLTFIIVIGLSVQRLVFKNERKD